MRRLSIRSTSLFLAGLLAVFGAACGDDDGNSGDNPDAGDGGDDTPDAGDGGDEPDAAPPIEVIRSGTVAIADITITNDLGVPISGGLAAINYTDLTTVTVAPVEGFDDPLGNCLITVYDVAAGEAEGDRVGEGVISVEGSANGPFSCGFNAAVGEYLCQSDDAASAGGDAEGAIYTAGSPTSTLTVPEGAFDEAAVTGAQLQLSGFDVPGINGALLPIVARPAPGTIVLATNGSPEFTSTGEAGATYATFIGAGPIPNLVGYDFFPAGSDVTISKDETENVPAFSLAGGAAGEGFELTGDSPQPDQVPADGSAVTFACEGDGCGELGGGGSLSLPVMVLNGVTTDADLTGTSPIDMPPAVNSYATFTCAGIVAGGGGMVSLSEDAMAAILGTAPSRIQYSIGRFAAAQLMTPTSAANVLAGHFLTGFTTVE